MISTRTRRAARATALGLSLALAAGGALLAAAPATAVDTPTEVHASDIAPVENGSTYTTWHQAVAGATSANYSITADGLQLTGESQIVHGYATGARPSGSDLFDLINSGDISWTTKAGTGAAVFQLPVAYGDSSAPETTTLRPATPVEGANTADVDQDWVSSNDITSASDGTTVVTANTPVPLGELISDLGTDTVQVLAFGVGSVLGTSPVVTGLHFDGTGYVFVQDPLAAGTATISGDAKVGSTLTVATAGWPAGTTFDYQWYYSGGQFGGEIENAANAPTYTLTEAETGLQVGVIVTGHKAGFAPTSVHSTNMTDWVVAPQKAAAPAPVASSDALPAYLAAQGVTPETPASAGLPASLETGKSYVAEVQWNGRDSFVDVYAYSTPVLVGSFPVVNGVVQISLSPALLASLAAGSHTLVISGQTSGTVQAVAFSVSAVAPAGVLAATGSDATVPAIAAGLLLLAGLALMVIRRRREARA
ncbi:LPXTG cell wall anchor domain-containing protein [Leifsonia sp. LS-T14]|uniref:LPXTG cell wall anchor domain-containing protein n=1 Tax=unclassified Leifsonia TaxID=2663824 RepID=UPI0035A72C70